MIGSGIVEHINGGGTMDTKTKSKVGLLRLKGLGIQEVVEATKLQRWQVESVFNQADAEEQGCYGRPSVKSKPFDFHAVSDKLEQLEKAVYCLGAIDILGGQTSSERENLIPELRAIDRLIARTNMKQFETRRAFEVVILRSRALMAIKEAYYYDLKNFTKNQEEFADMVFDVSLYTIPRIIHKVIKLNLAETNYVFYDIMMAMLISGAAPLPPP